MPYSSGLTKMIKHADGVRHRYKEKFYSTRKTEAQKIAKNFKKKGFYVRVIPGSVRGTKIWRVFAFALWD